MRRCCECVNTLQQYPNALGTLETRNQSEKNSEKAKTLLRALPSVQHLKLG
jgi:hypothetical protein